MGSRVLLLELDLRRPTIARAFGLSSGPGVADIIIGSCSLRDAIQSVGSGVAADARSTVRTLDVLVAGTALPPNPGELLESDAMQRLLEHLKAAYDLVVIDTPPLTAVSDAFPLLHRVDGVVIVGRVGRNRRDIAARLHETLTASDAPLLGVIANGIRSGAPGSYAYGYGYSYAPDGGGTRSQATSSNRASPEEPASAVDA
jgi:capsular exopolysaccharide synthesis family protein